MADEVSIRPEGAPPASGSQVISRLRLASPFSAFRMPEHPGRETSSLRKRSEASDTLKEDQGLLWIGFAFASGIVMYGALPEEPDWRVLTAISAAVACWILFTGKAGRLSILVLLVLALWAGVVAASVRTMLVAGPRLAEEITVTLTGQVLAVQPRQGGDRVVLRVLTVNARSVEGIPFPERVRVRLPKAAETHPGQTVSVRARLFPPPGPVVPGGYDFSFRAFFQQIGATGFAYGPPEPLPGLPPGLGLRAKEQISGMRANLADRIRAALPESPEAALAVALLVGDRSGIGEDEEENLRAAGLAHILAISGLHMALFAGGAFSVCLALLALARPLAVSWPIHKIAAGVALTAASYYLVLSGASVATQRSFIMIALVFLGVLFGRRGLTLRSVALAGLLLLMLAPERIFAPGFQMSFAAVIALVAIYGAWRGYRKASGWRPSQGGVATRVLRSLAGWTAGLLVTALIAGLATGIIAAHHFARIAPYGLIGNMLGMPVFSLVVMPMGVLALALMPFGLAVYPLKIMSMGLGLLLDIARFTAELTPDGGLIGKLPAGAAILLLAGLFIALLGTGRWRFLAVMPVAAGLLMAGVARPPDIQIAAAGDRMAARDGDGILRLSSGRPTFAAAVWLQAEGVAEETIPGRKMSIAQRRCDDEGCVIKAYSAGSKLDAGQETGKGAMVNERQGGRPILIAFPRTAEALRRDCRRADIVVSGIVAPPACSAPLVLDGPLRQRRGAVSIWLKPERSEPDDQDPDWFTRAARARDGSGINDADHRILDHKKLEDGSQTRKAADQTGSAPGRQATTAPFDVLQPARRDAGRTRRDVVDRVHFAVPIPPRPWHQPGTVTRTSLRQGR